jgi:very-short-patch-repair endonuclease
LFLLDLAKRMINDYDSSADALSKIVHRMSPSGLYSISELTRRNIMEELYSKCNIEGKLELTDFLNRIWNLEKMPSTDSRFHNAVGDIWQHIINNSDWDEAYLYENYLDLLTATDEIFIQFLEQVVHPLVRQHSEAREYIEFINNHLMKDGHQLIPSDNISGYTVYKINKIKDGVKGTAKNLIFAAIGQKPDIVISDSINNDIKIVNHESNCLVYDRPIPRTGLLWTDLVQWWSDMNGIVKVNRDVEIQLYHRLMGSLDSEPEKILFKSYFWFFRYQLNGNFPALIPQVYLHYDPYTQKQRFNTKVLSRQRMDFLLLFSNQQRIVIELDGKQHYSNGDISSPKLYAEMVHADRELKLHGYEVYRFGGFEFINEGIAQQLIKEFFERLFSKHGVKPNL